MTVKRYALYVGLGIIALGVIGAVIMAVFMRGSLTSWWRTPWHNKEIGGHIFSRHQVGLGYDLSPIYEEDRAKLETIASFWLFATVVDEGDHLHFQWV
jgi:hypothetical protein